MQVTNPNNEKIYNLSAGKSLPDWLTDRKKRKLQQGNSDIQKRIELIQDFEMPTVSSCVEMTRDGQYIYATGTYKPRVRCYDVSQMSLKFERCLDSEVVKFSILSDDYSKVCFLQADRYVEIHSQGGRYFRTRIPKFGRDMAYHYDSCDMYFASVSSEIYRLNLELGRYLSPLKTNASAVNCCEFNHHHGLLACGTQEGHVECWDPRMRTRAGILDCALMHHIEDLDPGSLPAITALRFRDGLHMAVGTSTGHVLLYDIRSDKPLLVKDHLYNLPIKRVEFHDSQDLVLSIDSKILKLWNRNTGKPFTAIEPGTRLNDLYLVQNSGLIFMANEAPKLLTYYIPSLGPAPKWCSFLDNLTEELEENEGTTVYDDYKFLTRKELDDLGLSHLIGSNLLRAYMHGFFMDIRLYQKAKAIAEPFAYEEYRKSKIREKIEQERSNRVKVKKLPKVNRDLAEKLMIQQNEAPMKKTGKIASSLLQDSRFSSMFTNPDFQVDPESEEYRLLNPVVSKLDKTLRKKQEREALKQFTEVEDKSGDEHGSDAQSSSSDDEHTWTEELKKQHRLMKREEKLNRLQMREERLKPKFYEIKEGQDFNSKPGHKEMKKDMKKSLEDRLASQNDNSEIKQVGSLGNREMVFSFKKSYKEKQQFEEARDHHQDRKKLRRSAGEITKKFITAPKFWMGKRVG